MAFRNLLQKFKYHYKKYFAVFFAVLAALCAFGDFVTTLVSLVQSTNAPNIMTFWNILFYLYAIYLFYLLYRGNKENSPASFQAVLMFTWSLLFYQIFTFIFDLLFNSPLNLLAFLEREEYLSFSFLISSYVILLAEIVVGIFGYIRLKQYMSGQYVSSAKIKVLFTIFFSMVILGSVPAVYLLILLNTNIFTILFYSYASFGAIASIFTILRLSD